MRLNTVAISEAGEAPVAAGLATQEAAVFPLVVTEVGAAAVTAEILLSFWS